MSEEFTYRFQVQTRKGRHKYQLLATQDTPLSAVFIEIVKGSQDTKFPIPIKRQNGEPIPWRFHVVNEQNEARELVADHSMAQNNVEPGELIYAYDNSDAGSGGSRSGGGGLILDDGIFSNSPTKPYQDGDDEIITIIPKSRTLNTGELTPSPFAKAERPRSAPAHSGPDFPQAIKKHLAILHELILLNPSILSTSYQWTFTNDWKYGWDSVPIQIQNVPGVVGLDQLKNPIIRMEHEFLIYIPSNFPEVRPKAIPRSPMWHPNIYPGTDVEDGDICWIGDWTIDEIDRCLERMLVNVVELLQYKIYREAPHDRMNPEASQWAREKYGSLQGPGPLQPTRILRRT